MSKKKNSIFLSIAEVEYITAGSCCTQLLWMQKLLLDYSIRQEHLTIYCDNTSAINISKNPVQHSRTKHKEIQHHFIWELVEDGTLTLEFIHTDDQKANLFTKPLDSKRFEFLCQNIGVISMDWLIFSSSFLMHLHLVLCIALFNMFLFVLFSVLFFIIFFFWKIRKIQKEYVVMYIGTCVPYMAIETKFSKFCIFCIFDEHLYAEISKWSLWLVFVMSKIK